MASVPVTPEPRPPAPRSGAMRVRRVAVLLAAAAALLGASWWMTGPAPAPVGVDAPAAPPLVLPPDAAAEDELARAAAHLVTGDVDAATELLVELAAQRADDPVPQVGLALARWSTLGPAAVERDLAQLEREYPQSAYVALHLGMARQLRGDEVAARAVLVDAVERGRAEGGMAPLRMARFAEDLLHPELLRGYPPLLIGTDQVPAQARAALHRARAAVAADDRVGAAAAADELRPIGAKAATQPLLAAAAAVASWDKAVPEKSREALAAAVADAPDDAPGIGLARLQLAMLELWERDEEAACPRLRALAQPAGASEAADAASTDRVPNVAAGLVREMCTDRGASES